MNTNYAAGSASPAAKKIIAEKGLDIEELVGTGRNGRITKEDAFKAVPSMGTNPIGSKRVEERKKLSLLRRKVAERLVAVKNETAMLTTFNEVDMQPVMELRTKYKAQFEKMHNGTRLGFMSFFVRAATEALKRFPAVNASIDEQHIVYHGYYDIGVAVSSDRGLVVPVLRDTDSMSLASIESKIREFGNKAADGKLSIDDMTGGTFTITNGGVFVCLMFLPEL